jgi:4-amino-4-deoxy-L-arabinose transferase-like glycosyltransferase
MGVPFDAISVTAIAVAALALAAAWLIRRPLELRVASIVVAALVIRLDASYQRSLHPWDERYHALVAKHLVDEPLRPTLYRTPALPYAPRDWTANHVWLHKPPGALWLMAISMRIFGVSELALRLPSLMLSTGAVFLTFLLGRRLFDSRVGLLAAGFHAVNGFLVALASGRRVADHVDTALIVAVELGIWAIVTHTETARRRWLLVAGTALGAGLLVKSFPALVILPVAFVQLLRVFSWRAAAARVALVAAAGATVAAPWTVFTHLRYPEEAAWTTRFALMHITTVVEGQASSSWTYLRDLPRFFGELVPVPMVMAAITALRLRWSPLSLVLVWVAVPYLTFSLVATRLPGYVMVAAPALFLIQAWAWIVLRDRLRQSTAATRRLALAALLVLLALLPGRYLLEPSGPFERRDRWPAQTRRFAGLHARLGRDDAVLFNVPDEIQAMFYSPYTAYSRMPTTSEVAALRARRVDVVIYAIGGQPVRVPSGWDVIVLHDMGGEGDE